MPESEPDPRRDCLHALLPPKVNAVTGDEREAGARERKIEGGVKLGGPTIPGGMERGRFEELMGQEME